MHSSFKSSTKISFTNSKPFKTVHLHPFSPNFPKLQAYQHTRAAVSSIALKANSSIPLRFVRTRRRIGLLKKINSTVLRGETKVLCQTFKLSTRLASRQAGQVFQNWWITPDKVLVSPTTRTQIFNHSFGLLNLNLPAGPARVQNRLSGTALHTTVWEVLILGPSNRSAVLRDRTVCGQELRLNATFIITERTNASDDRTKDRNQSLRGTWRELVK